MIFSFVKVLKRLPRQTMKPIRGIIIFVMIFIPMIRMQPTFPICESYENELQKLDILGAEAKEVISRMYDNTNEIYLKKVEQAKNHYLAKVQNHEYKTELIQCFEDWSVEASNIIIRPKNIYLMEYDMYSKSQQFDVVLKQVRIERMQDIYKCDNVILGQLNAIAEFNHKLRGTLHWHNLLTGPNAFLPVLKFEMPDMGSRLQKSVQSMRIKTIQRIINKSIDVLKQVATEQRNLFDKQWQHSREVLLKEADQCVSLNGHDSIKIVELHRSVKLLHEESDQFEKVDLAKYIINFANVKDLEDSISLKVEDAERIHNQSNEIRCREDGKTITLEIATRSLKEHTDRAIPNIYIRVKKLNQALQLVEYAISNFEIK